MEEEKIYIDYFHSFIGIFEIKANDRYLLSIRLSKSISIKDKEINNITDMAKEWFDAYFQKIILPIPPLQPAKTLFSQKVREAALEISFGECKTYSDIAKKINHPKAYRAVAQALKLNPFMIIVPCHRVISKKGIGGYNGGIEIKKKLLEFEGCESINL